MSGNLDAYMKVGIVHFMAFPETMTGEGPVLETLRTIVEDEFFGAVEVTRIQEPAVRARAADLLRASGLEVGFGAQPVLLGGKHDLNALDEDVRRAAVAACREALAQAAELGATKFAVLSGPDPGEAARERATEQLRRSLVEIGREARERGMALALETFDRAIDKRCLVGPNADAARLAREVRRDVPEFGLMIDLSHLPLQFETARDALPAARDVLIHAHVGNCILKDRSHPAYGDQHPRFCHPAGENGVAELRDFLRVLLEIGYLQKGLGRIVAFEVKPLPGESSLAVVAQAKRTLKEAWAGIE